MNKWTQKKNVDETFLILSYLQKIVMWKLLVDLRECNPWKLINNGNGK